MSIESTQTVTRQEAIDILTSWNITVFEDDCDERLTYELYENRKSTYVNYIIEEENNLNNEDT